MNSEANSLYHRAFKKVEFWDLKTNQKVTPVKENAWKFELFLQNFMSSVPSGKLGVLEVDRNFEFAPIKNADLPDQTAVDSPASAR